MQLTDPVSAAEFAARLDALNVGGSFAIAVSGGRDSMALARLCAGHAKTSDRRVVALIVDHGLRDGAADEARRAKTWCAQAGLDARILEWRGGKPASGVQEAARKARYRLLAEAANDLGLPAILTAHSADDQAETLLMRLARGAGPAGLAAMDDEIGVAAGAGDPVRLVRPLLPFSRDALTATVQEYNQDYVDDPSNDDPRFERIRVRRFLRDAVEKGAFDQAALLRSARRMAGTRRDARTRERRAFRAMGGVFTRWGGACLDVGSVTRGDALGAVARAIRAVSGADHAPDPDAAAAHFDTALARGAAAIGGALLKRSGERLWILREPAAVLGRAGVAPLADLEIPAGGRALWDNRFIVKSAETVTVRPLGEAGAKEAASAAALFEGPREGLLSAPGLYRGGRLIGAPGLLSGGGGAWSATPLAAERFSGEIVRFSQD